MVEYDLTRIKAFAFDVDGVLSPSTIPLGEDGYPRRMANVKDGYAIQLAVKKGYKMAIISGGKGEPVYKRFASLGIKEIHLNATEKLPLLKDWMRRENLKPEEVVYMGDDIPDLLCMRYVGVPCAPFDACWEARQTALYISKFSGGYGCGRDILEQVMKAQGLWLNEHDAFGW